MHWILTEHWKYDSQFEISYEHGTLGRANVFGIQRVIPLSVTNPNDVCTGK